MPDWDTFFLHNNGTYFGVSLGWWFFLNGVGCLCLRLIISRYGDIIDVVGSICVGGYCVIIQKVPGGHVTIGTFAGLVKCPRDVPIVFSKGPCVGV